MRLCKILCVSRSLHARSLVLSLISLDQFSSYTYDSIKSNAGVRDDLFHRDLTTTLVTDFFGGVAQVELVDSDSSTANVLDNDFASEPADEEVLTKESHPINQEDGLVFDDVTSKQPVEPSEGRKGSLWAAVLALGTLAGWSLVTGLRS